MADAKQTGGELDDLFDSTAALGGFPSGDNPDEVRTFVHTLENPPKPEKNMLDETALEFKEAGNKAFRAGPEHYEEALKKYTDAIALCETNPPLLSTLCANRALLYLHKREFGLALLDARKALKNNPRNGKAFIRAGQACQRSERPKMAVAFFNLCLDRADSAKTKAFAANILKQILEEEQKKLKDPQPTKKGKTAVPVSPDQIKMAGSISEVGPDGKIRQRSLTLEEMKARKDKFDEICDRHRLKFAEPMEAISNYLTSLNGKVATAEDFRKQFPIFSHQEAVDFLSWIQTGIQFKEQVMDANKNKLAPQQLR